MADAIPAENLRQSLKYIVNELLESFCESEKEHGIEVSILDEQVQVEMAVIIPGGRDLLDRRSVTTSGEERSTTMTGEKVTADEESTFTSSQNTEAFISVGTVTKVDPETTTTRRSPFKTSKSIQESTPDVSVESDYQQTAQDSTRSSFGQNTVERVNTYDTI